MPSMTTAKRSRADGNRPATDQVDAVLMASRALVGIAAQSLADVSERVTMPQLRVLVMLYTQGPLNLAAVATGLDVNPSNASRTCDRLLKAGLLDRQILATDRRNVTLTLTPLGRRLVKSVTTRRRTAIERVLRKMRAADRQQLAEALARFAQAADEPVGDDIVTLIWPPTP